MFTIYLTFISVFAVSALLYIFSIKFVMRYGAMKTISRKIRARRLAPELEEAISLSHSSVSERNEVLGRIGGLANIHMLHEKRVFIAGCGSMGSWIAYYLAMNHIRNFFLLDFDRVELGNLEGRTSYQSWHIGANKAVALADILNSIDIQIYAQPIIENAEILLDERIAGMLEDMNLIINVFDDMDTLLAVNRTYYNRIPQLFAGFHRNGESGHVIFTIPGVTPCFECAMGVVRARSLRRMDRAIALPNDIQRVAYRAVEIALSLLTMDQPQTPLRERFELWQSNYLFITNRGQNAYRGTWIDTRSRRNCQVCGTDRRNR